MPLKIPRIIGHRGACAYAPENTIASIRTAAELGVKWVELDVKLTRDQVPIIFHDEELDRTTSGSGLVKNFDWKDLQELDAGSWFGESFIGTPIPTLEETVDELTRLGLGFNLEIKPCPGREKETTEVALDLMSRIWDNHDGLLISSFQHVSLETAMDMASDWARGLLLDTEWPPNWKELAEYLDVVSVNINGNEVTREQVEDIIDQEKMVMAYTINDPRRALILEAWGVDAVFTNVPDLLMDDDGSVH